VVGGGGGLVDSGVGGGGGGGRGWGGAMMDEAEGLARKAGARGMELHVFTGNEGAIGFYEGRGYERVGVVTGFYGVGMDGLVYRKGLVA